MIEGKNSYSTANRFILCSVLNVLCIKTNWSKTMFFLLCSKRALQHLFQMCYHIPKLPYVFWSLWAKVKVPTDSKCSQSERLLSGFEFISEYLSVITLNHCEGMAAAQVTWDLCSTIEFEDKRFFVYFSGGASAARCLHTWWRPNSSKLSLKRERWSSGTFSSSVKKKRLTVCLTAVDVFTVSWDHKNMIQINILMKKA